MIKRFLLVFLVCMAFLINCMAPKNSLDIVKDDKENELPCEVDFYSDTTLLQEITLGLNAKIINVVIPCGMMLVQNGNKTAERIILEMIRLRGKANQESGKYQYGMPNLGTTIALMDSKEAFSVMEVLIASDFCTDNGEEFTQQHFGLSILRDMFFYRIGNAQRIKYQTMYDKLYFDKDPQMNSAECTIYQEIYDVMYPLIKSELNQGTIAFKKENS